MGVEAEAGTPRLERMMDDGQKTFEHDGAPLINQEKEEKHKGADSRRST